jgi:hypothetical protein
MPEPQQDQGASPAEQPFNPQVFLETGQKLIASGLAKAVYRPTKNGREIVAAVLPVNETSWLAFSTFDLQVIMFSLDNPQFKEKFSNDAAELTTGVKNSSQLSEIIYAAQAFYSGFTVTADSRSHPDAIIDALPQAIKYAKAQLEQMKANRERAAAAAVKQFKFLGFD